MELGSTGKAKAILSFITHGYDVFTEFEGKSPFDFIVHKTNELKRVEVKTSKTRNRANTGWIFQIKKVRPNRTKAKIYRFNKSQCDILALYIQPLDKIIIKFSNQIFCTSSFTILDTEINGSVAEWFIAPDLKSDTPKGVIGSTPITSAIK